MSLKAAMRVIVNVVWMLTIGLGVLFVTMAMMFVASGKELWCNDRPYRN